MIIHSIDAFAVPPILVAEAVEAYLLMVLLRLILGRFARVQSHPRYLALQQLTDDIPRALDKWLAAKRQQANPQWLPWVIVIVTLLLVRQCVVGIIMVGS